MHCRPFYLHVTRWNGHAINNHSQLRETTSFSCANARDNASSLVWHPKERSRQPEIIHPAGIAIGRVRTRRSHPNVHNCESGGPFDVRVATVKTFQPANRLLFCRPFTRTTKIVKDVCQENVEASPSSLRPFIKRRDRGETSSLFRERSSKSLHVTVFFHPPRQIVQETRHTLAGKNDRSMRCLSFSNRFYFIWKKGREKVDAWIDRIGQFRIVCLFLRENADNLPVDKGRVGTYWPNGGGHE